MTFRWRLSHHSRLIDALKDRVGPSYSARFLKRALEANICRVNGRIERFASAALKNGDVIELKADWANLPNQALEQAILFENNELVAIAKSPSSVCSDAYFQKILGREVFLAHRLDKDTTGVLLFGKTRLLAKELQDLFEKRAIEKEYLALVDGEVRKDQGIIENFLVKKGSYQGQTIWGSSASSRGLHAKTTWQKIASSEKASLLRCRPMTGRTHQIRVHLSEMGHPILVDRQYAANFVSSIFVTRPMLHAHRLRFSWRGEYVDLLAPLPNDFIDVCRHFGFSYDPSVFNC